MEALTESIAGIYLHNLELGSVLAVETKSRHHYTIQYVGGDLVMISGHPTLCPKPVSAELCGSIRGGQLEAGFVGEGLCLTFRRLTDEFPVITSAIQTVHQESPASEVKRCFV